MKYLIALLALLPLFGFAQHNFPKEWEGSYIGTMKMANQNGTIDSVEVVFHLHQINENRWQFKFIFRNEQLGEIDKDYALIWNDTLGSPNTFLLDENNGMLLYQQYLNGRLYGHYELLNIHYMTEMYSVGINELFYDLRASTMLNPLKTSAKENGTEYHVSSFKHFTVQSVLLRKIDKN